MRREFLSARTWDEIELEERLEELILLECILPAHIVLVEGVARFSLLRDSA